MTDPPDDAFARLLAAAANAHLDWAEASRNACRLETQAFAMAKTFGISDQEWERQYDEAVGDARAARAEAGDESA